MPRVEASIAANPAGIDPLSPSSARLPDRMSDEQDRSVEVIVQVDRDEFLIVDDRSRMSPAEMVENKLSRMLKDGSMPVSHLQMRKMLNRR